MKANQALETARKAVNEIKARAQQLARDAETARAEFDAADAELVNLLGLQQLGEADAEAVDAARERRDKADLALRGLDSALEVLAARLPAANEAANEAGKAFYADAADALRPKLERLRESIHQHFDGLASDLARYAQVDAICNRIERGTRTGAALLRTLGDPQDVARVAHGVTIEVAVPNMVRMTEAEVLALIEQPAKK